MRGSRTPWLGPPNPVVDAIPVEEPPADDPDVRRRRRTKKPVTTATEPLETFKRGTVLDGDPPAPAAPPPPAAPPEPPLDPVEVKARGDARAELTRVRAQIQEKTAILLTADPSDIAQLTQELQRLRVASLMLREIVEDVADPNAYKELKLLKDMMSGLDPEEEARRRESEQAEADAAQRLAGHNMTPERASNLVRALTALQDVMNRPAPAPVEEPEADDARPAPGAELRIA